LMLNVDATAVVPDGSALRRHSKQGPEEVMITKRKSGVRQAAVKPRLSLNQDAAGRSHGKLSSIGIGRESVATKHSCWERVRQRSRLLCDSWRFSVLTTGLTVYALFGDDFRLAATHKRTDILFNVLTIGCIGVFTLEIVASSLGKEEYFMGFFFMLDAVSTITLLMDLTWVGNILFCSGDEGGSALKTSRAGRAGARAGRTVRIIRLIRLVKLYKTYKTAVEQQEKIRRRSSMESRCSMHIAPGDEETEDPDDGERDDLRDKPQAQAKAHAETRVGKKLSDMTTRRVIILVLVMLFCMPLFVPSTYGAEELRHSAHLGVELIYERWRSWCPVLHVEPAIAWCLRDDSERYNESFILEKRVDRWWFEDYLLTYVYQHHHSKYAWELYWVGLNSMTLTGIFEARQHGTEDAVDKAGSYLGSLAQLNQPRYLGSLISPLSEWDGRYADPTWQVSVSNLPDTVKEKLRQPWIEKCRGKFYGVPIITVVDDAKDPMDCSIDEDLRCSEVEFYLPERRTEAEGQSMNMLFAFDTRGTTVLEAALSMLQTVFICFAVGVGAMSFSNDANQLLLNPIERMISKMETIKDNPLEAMRLGDLEYRREEIENAKRKEQLANKSRYLKWIYKHYHAKKTKEPMETVILEKTIIKLGGLLALGFGEAGAEIIGQNMRGGHSAGVDAMVPGHKVDAIIGFCNIRNFTDATEVLKEKVMLFVNQVGEIVHGCVDDYHGAPNKNIGDSFLLVWRLSGASAERQTKLADMAIMSFIKIVAAINKSPVLAEYRGHPGMLQRVPNYRVQMGFGLHCGWAIEGAIGSKFKIDASYLSPNVNVAARLENATKQFSVWILISHFMINLCSQEIALICRLIDHVTVKGSKQPVRLYTIDLDYMQLEVVHKSMDRVIKNRFKVRQVREVRKNEKWAEDHNVAEALEVDPDLVRMRSTYSAEFFQRFSMAYRNYEAGEWMVARDMLYTCHYSPKSSVGSCAATTEEEWPCDGPTTTLLCFMKQGHFTPPADWPGHRVLTEK